MSEVRGDYPKISTGHPDAGRAFANALDSSLARESKLIADFDRVTAELTSANSDKEAYAQNAIDLRKRVDALQSLLTAADERADVLEGLLRTSLVAMTRIYSAGRDLIIGAGSDCDSVELMMENDPTAREIRAALKPADVFVDPIKSCDVRRRAYLPGLWCKGLDGELQRVRAVLNPTPRLLLVPAGTGTTDLR